MATTTESVDLVGSEVTVNLARAALFAALMGAFAFVSFPNPLAPSIPVTLQVLGVFLAGIYLGPLWGGFSLLLYLTAGAVGVPVFAGGEAGLGVLLGPTGGYLLSYPFAAAVVGAGVHGTDGLVDPQDVPVGRLVTAMIGGTVVIYLLGILGYWLAVDVGLVTATLSAALSFVPMEAVKIAAAVLIVRSDAVRAN